jgi:serine/threonine protein phosphatase PrpC
MSMNFSWKKEKIAIRWVEGFQFQGNAPIQEDFFSVNPDRGIFILADGFGGSSGKNSAESAVLGMKKFLEQEAGDLDATLPFELRPYFSLAGNVLFNAVAFANQKVNLINEGRPTAEKGGASVVAGYLEGRLLAIANVGACKVHLFRNGKSKEIVNPKTLERQVNPFQEDGDTAVPLMSFGTTKQLEPEVVEIELMPGDRVCFSSCGVQESLRNQLFQLQNHEDFSREIGNISQKTINTPNGTAIFVSF